eukprot:768388-Hanusia_phi.AAC.11
MAQECLRQANEKEEAHAAGDGSFLPHRDGAAYGGRSHAMAYGIPLEGEEEGGRKEERRGRGGGEEERRGREEEKRKEGEGERGGDWGEKERGRKGGRGVRIVERRG